MQSKKHRKPVCPKCNDKGTRVAYCILCGRALCRSCRGRGYFNLTIHENGRIDEIRYPCRNCKSKGFTR